MKFNQSLASSACIFLSIVGCLILLFCWSFVLTMSTDGGDYIISNRGVFAVMLPSLLLLVLTTRYAVKSIKQKAFIFVNQLVVLPAIVLLMAAPFILYPPILILIAVVAYMRFYFLVKKLNKTQS